MQIWLFMGSVVYRRSSLTAAFFRMRLFPNFCANADIGPNSSTYNDSTNYTNLGDSTGRFPSNRVYLNRYPPYTDSSNGTLLKIGGSRPHQDHERMAVYRTRVNRWKD